jgi:DNA-binding MarR family transcriptional regulator
METVHDKCAAGTLRRATRSVARLYDRKLARAGLTSRLADQLVFERTSLYRALEPLRREGLITIEAGAGARSKEAALTRKGHTRIAQAQPHWQEAQNEFLGQFGKAAWSSLAVSLGEIVDAARAAGDGE